MATYHSGKLGKVRLNSTPATLAVTDWSVTEDIDVVDTTNSEGAGYREQVGGTTGVTGRVTAFWDSAGNQHTTPFNLFPGTQITTLVLYLNNTTGKSWSFALADVTNLEETSEVRGGIKFTFTFMSNGSYTRPT